MSTMYKNTAELDKIDDDFHPIITAAINEDSLLKNAVI